MDRAWIGSVDISIDKAWTSRAFDITTKDLGENSQPGDQFFGIHASNRGRVMIFAGGIPLKRGIRWWELSASAAVRANRITPSRKQAVRLFSGREQRGAGTQSVPPCRAPSLVRMIGVCDFLL
jgi:hypothetical protein